MEISEIGHTYTGGSKVDQMSGTAVHFPSFPDLCVSFRLTDGTSIFTAEAFAILFALEQTREILDSNHFVIFTDSLSCLQAIKNNKIENVYIRRCLDRLDVLSSRGQTVALSNSPPIRRASPPRIVWNRKFRQHRIFEKTRAADKDGTIKPARADTVV